jgi:hypothetical protein
LVSSTIGNRYICPRCSARCNARDFKCAHNICCSQIITISVF